MLDREEVECSHLGRTGLRVFVGHAERYRNRAALGAQSDVRLFATTKEGEQLVTKPSNNRLKLTARGRSGAKSLRRTRAAA